VSGKEALWPWINEGTLCCPSVSLCGGICLVVSKYDGVMKIAAMGLMRNQILAYRTQNLPILLNQTLNAILEFVSTCCVSQFQE
jgi:hypothetical protein